MGAFKKLLRPRVIAWAGTSVLVAAFLVTATILTTRTFKVLLEGKFGGDTAITPVLLSNKNSLIKMKRVKTVIKLPKKSAKKVWFFSKMRTTAFH